MEAQIPCSGVLLEGSGRGHGGILIRPLNGNLTNFRSNSLRNLASYVRHAHKAGLATPVELRNETASSDEGQGVAVFNPGFPGCDQEEVFICSSDSLSGLVRLSS